MALLGCGPKLMKRGKRLAGAKKFFSMDAGGKWKTIMPRLHDHHDLFQSCISSAFTDPVYGAFHLARSRFNGGQRIGHSKTQIIVTVDANNGPDHPKR